MKPRGSLAFEVCTDSPRAWVFVARCSARLCSGTVPSRITPQASSDISSFTQHLAASLLQALCGTGGHSPLLQHLALSSKLHMQPAHVSLPRGVELTPLYIVTELDGSQATCPILPARSEELFCGSQSPCLCASFPISFLCLLVLSISRLHPWQ